MQVPFVDEVRLQAASAAVPSELLTEAERSRNMLGSILVFTFDGGEGKGRALCDITGLCDVLGSILVFTFVGGGKGRVFCDVMGAVWRARQHVGGYF